MVTVWALNWNGHTWLNDHWNYHLGYNSQADIPLQAVKDGFEGKSYAVGVDWQQNESRKAGAIYQLTDIDDGNTRQEVAAYFMQQDFPSAASYYASHLTWLLRKK